MEDLYPLGRTPKTFEIIISDSMQDENMINSLVKIIRVPYYEYIPKDEEEAVNFSSTLFLLKWEYCLDENFFKNIFENKEKLKIIIRYFESILNSLKREKNKHIEFVISGLKSAIFYLSKLMPDLKTILADEEKLKIGKQQKSLENKELIYPTTEIKIPFEANLFKDEYSTKLFCYLIDHYHKGKDKELSNIYQWMENNNFIHQNKRKEYKELVKKYEITKLKYGRVHSSNEYIYHDLDPTFNELQKRFDKEIK